MDPLGISTCYALLVRGDLGEPEHRGPNGSFRQLGVLYVGVLK